MSSRETDFVVKSGLKLKKGNLFKPGPAKKKYKMAVGGSTITTAASSRSEEEGELRKIDLTIRKDEESTNHEVKKTAAELASRSAKLPLSRLPPRVHYT